MSEIRIEKDDVVATVIISNPRKFNALNVAMWKALEHAFTVLSQDESLRCVIVSGDGQNFTSGADVEEFSTVRSTMEQGIRYHTETLGNALQAISQCLHPTVAAIEGVCIGGGLEIACACDLRIAAPNARVGMPINRLGFSLAPTEMQYLLQLLGKANLLEILLEGRVFSASEAKDKGLINRVADDVQAEARRTAQRVAQGAPLAARMNKKMMRRLSPPPEPLTKQELQEAFAFLASQDYREGVQTFLSKRKPVFSGK
jgi:enoyl-CoA hydratase